MEKEIQLSRIDPDTAAAWLSGSAHLDPAGLTTERDIVGMTHTGQCFAATAKDSQAVYILKVQNGTAWVDALKGFGALDWISHILPIIEAQAKGCAAVAFQTRRPGLVRKAKKQGYTVAGYILRKSLT